jgi:amino acid permease
MTVCAARDQHAVFFANESINTAIAKDAISSSQLTMVYVTVHYVFILHYCTQTALPFITGLFLYCFEAIGMILPLEASTKNKAQFTPILCAVIVIYAAMCALMGIFGYLAYGSSTQDIILLNMTGKVYSSIVKVSNELSHKHVQTTMQTAIRHDVSADCFCNCLVMPNAIAVR